MQEKILRLKYYTSNFIYTKINSNIWRHKKIQLSTYIANGDLLKNKYNATICNMMFYHYICTVFTMYEN